ncbi:MAG: ribosome silencing factor [Methylomonas sp.]
MQTDELVKLIETELDFRKGENLVTLYVGDKSTITDYMVIASATSSRHAKSLSDYVAEKAKEHGVMPLGIEGAQVSDWVLLDLGDVIVHVMTGQAREFYQLEKLWSVPATTVNA